MARADDAERRRGRAAGRFLLLGSASVELLRQPETLAGRIAYIEMPPLDVLETPDDRQTDLTMLAHVQGGIFNAAQLARGLAVDGKTVVRQRPEKGFLIACEDVKPDHRFVVNSGTELYPVSDAVEANTHPA